MAKKEDLTFEVKEFIGAISEDSKSDWCKAVTRISWNGNPPKIDIRSINIPLNRVRGGIPLTDEETDRLVDLLLENEFGSMDALSRAVEKRRSRFTILSGAADSVFGNDEEDVMKVTYRF